MKRTTAGLTLTELIGTIAISGALAVALLNTNLRNNVETSNITTQVRTLTRSMPGQAAAEKQDIHLLNIGNTLTLALPNGTRLSKGVPIPEGASAVSTLKVTPTGDSQGNVQITTPQGCLQFTPLPYGGLEERSC